MFKGFSGLIVPIVLMLAVFAILAGLDPTTASYTPQDKSYLDKEVVQLTATQFFMAIGAFLAFVGLIHKTGNDNGHAGAGHNFVTFALLAAVVIIVVMALGGAQ